MLDEIQDRFDQRGHGSEGELVFQMEVAFVTEEFQSVGVGRC